EIEPVADPGRFEHDIEPAELAHDSGNGPVDRPAVADVERRRGCAPTGSTNPGSGFLRRRAVAVGTEHRRALARQSLGSGAADAATRARNQRHFARNPPHAALPSGQSRVSTMRRGNWRDEWC